MKIKQIAIWVPDNNFFSENLNNIFGFKFYSDNLKMDGFFDGNYNKNVDLNLSFNHEMMDGVELEFINSKSEYHWHQDLKKKFNNLPFLSHLGVYCESKAECILIFEKMKKFEIIQNTTSHDHSNLRKTDIDKSSRRYRDIIYNSHEKFGFNLKLSMKF